MIGILGPNGAGKMTLTKRLMTGARRTKALMKPLSKSQEICPRPCYCVSINGGKHRKQPYSTEKRGKRNDL